MPNEAVGYVCPACGSNGNIHPHHVHRVIRYSDGSYSVRLSCHTCEHVWNQPVFQ